MNDARASDGLSRDALRRILDITRDLARPLDLGTMLYAVVDAAKDLLDAEGGTVWQYQPADHMLEMRVARGLDAIRIPADRGIVGECVRTLATINVPDCYADPRFNRDVDKATGRRTRCLLTLPLIGDDDHLVGVLQVVNRHEGVFDEQDEAVAAALALPAVSQAESTTKSAFKFSFMISHASSSPSSFVSASGCASSNWEYIGLLSFRIPCVAK